MACTGALWFLHLDKRIRSLRLVCGAPESDPLFPSGRPRIQANVRDKKTQLQLGTKRVGLQFCPEVPMIVRPVVSGSAWVLAWLSERIAETVEAEEGPVYFCSRVRFYCWVVSSFSLAAQWEAEAPDKFRTGSHHVGVRFGSVGNVRVCVCVPVCVCGSWCVCVWVRNLTNQTLVLFSYFLSVFFFQVVNG